MWPLAAIMCDVTIVLHIHSYTYYEQCIPQPPPPPPTHTHANAQKDLTRLLLVCVYVFVCVYMYVCMYMVSTFSVVRQSDSPIEWFMHHFACVVFHVQPDMYMECLVNSSAECSKLS